MRYGVFEAFGSRWRATTAYVIRDIKNHRAGPRLGLIVSVIETIAAIMILALLFSLIGRQAAYGTSIVKFMFTGLAPFMLFMRVSSRVGNAVNQANRSERLPALTVTGIAVALAFSTLAITLMAILLMLAAFHLYGIDGAVPPRVVYCLSAIALLALLGFGVGLINAVISRFMPAWTPVFEMTTRGLLLLSGIFYVPDFMPAQARDVLAWNPLLHGVAMFRLGFYEDYPTFIYAPNYLIGWAMGAFVIAIWAARLFRKRLVAV